MTQPPQEPRTPRSADDPRAFRPRPRWRGQRADGAEPPAPSPGPQAQPTRPQYTPTHVYQMNPPSQPWPGLGSDRPASPTPQPQPGQAQASAPDAPPRRGTYPVGVSPAGDYLPPMTYPPHVTLQQPGAGGYGAPGPVQGAVEGPGQPVPDWSGFNQPGSPVFVPNPPDSARRSKIGIIVFVGLVVLALIAGLIWILMPKQAEPSPSPTVDPRSSSAQPTQESSSSPSAAEVLSAPGPGTTTSLRTYLEGKSFECVDEKTEGIVSYQCFTRGKGGMNVYVGGRPDGGLGQVSAWSVASDDAGDIELRDYLLTQFLADETDVAKAKTELAKGTVKAYAKVMLDGNVGVWGEAKGGLIMRIKNWTQGIAAPSLSLTVTSLKAALSGYECIEEKAQEATYHKCTKAANGVTYSVGMSARGNDIWQVSVWAEGKDSDAALKSEVTTVKAGSFPTYIETVSAAASDGVLFSGPIIIDYYRNVERKSSKERSSGIVVRTSCWAGKTPWC